ncbi:MAG TPA: hypothetical protein VF077_09005 [Nitrospiraceae bacterium]
MEIKLAEALLRRKELQGKVDQLKQIKDRDLFEVKGKRSKVTDDVDDIVLQVPLLSASQVTHEYDWYAKQLRHVDAAIQQVNWTATVEVPEDSMADYKPPELQRQGMKQK